MRCARWRSGRRGKHWGFSAGLSVPNWEEREDTSPKVLALAWTRVQKKRRRTMSRSFAPTSRSVINAMCLKWYLQQIATPASTTLPCEKHVMCFTVEPGKRRGRATASHLGKLWVLSWHERSQLFSCSARMGTLLAFPCPVLHTPPPLSAPVCTRRSASQGRTLAFRLVSSNSQHHDRRFFAILYSGFSWISHPYVQCSTESYWLSGPLLEPVLWANVALAMFPSLGTSFGRSDRLCDAWGHLRCHTWILSWVNSVQS